MRVKKSSGFKQFHTYYGFAILLVIILAFSVLTWISGVGRDGVVLQPPTIIPVTSCGLLNTNNAVYQLSTAISPTAASCLHITANDSILDGVGNQGIIQASTVGQGIGILVEGQNVVIRDLSVSDFQRGIDIFNTSFVNVSGGEVKNNALFGVLLNESDNLNISDVVAEGNAVGVFLDDVVDSVIGDSDVFRLAPLAGGLVSGGMVLLDSDDNLLKNNQVVNVDIGIGVYGSDSNSLLDNGINFTILKAIDFLNVGSGNSVEEGLIADSLGDAVSANVVADLFFKNVDVRNTAGIDLDLISNVGGIVLEDSYLPNYNFLTDGVVLRFKKSGLGEIAFLEKVNGTGMNLSDDLKIEGNLVEINSDSLLEFNKSANVTLEGLGSFVYPEIRRNDTSCPENVCTSIGSLTGSKVMFSVTGWTNYSIGEGTPPGATLSISEPDEDDEYELQDFPVTFRVELNLDGAVNFSLNSGRINITMNTTDNRSFRYDQEELNLGNYTFDAYAIVDEFNAESLSDSHDFVVIPNSGFSGGGNNAGNNGTNGTGAGTGNTGSFGAGSTGTTSAVNASSGSGEQSSVELKDVFYWLIVAILAIAVVILILLLVRHLRNRTLEKISERPRIVSGLR